MHGLGDLVSLQELEIIICHEFMQLPDLHKLTTLRQLIINHCGIEVAQRLRLQEVFVCEVRKLVDLHLLMRHLRRLWNIYFNIQDMMPWSGSFIVLGKLILERLLGEVEYLPGIDNLTRLRRLKVFGAPHLLYWKAST